MRSICLAACAALLFACDWKPGSADLTAHTTAAQVGPDCAGCHAYSDIDDNHAFHLSQGGRNPADRSPVTCLDCHFTAMAHTENLVLDSVFVDSAGDTYTTVDYPDSPDVRGFTLVRIDTVHQQLPVPAPARPGATPLYQEYVTALAHLNDTVEVTFSARVAGGGGRRSAGAPQYNYQEQTCSAVACHRSGDAYPWRDQPDNGQTPAPRIRSLNL